ncbi:MAG: hypothetical protein RSC29_02560 [Oscillospiraceae bacterium]
MLPTSTKTRRTVNNVYKWPQPPQTRPGIQREDLIAEPIYTENKKLVKKAEKAKQGNKHMLRTAAIIALVFGLCFTLLYRYSMILEANEMARNLESEYNKIVSQNQYIQTKIGKSIETATLENIAINQLGMVKPDTAQVIYVDMNMGDKSEPIEVAKNSESTAVMGMPGTLIRAFQMLK